MWARVLMIAACAINVAVDATSRPAVTLEIGEKLETSIVTFPHTKFSCYLETPAKEIIQFQPENHADLSKYEVVTPNLMIDCAVSVIITGPEDNGEWRLFFKTEDGNVENEIYSVIVHATTGDDDTNESDQKPSEDTENREVEYLEKETIRTQIGAVHKITIKKYDFVITESCHIVTPGGTEYTSADHDIPGLKWIVNDNEDCGVEINVDGKDMVGIWTLYSRAVRHSATIEKRLPFVIYVEEFVKATPQEVTIAVGNDLHIRLVDPPTFDLQDTCRVIGPNQDDTSFYKIDANHIETCGFIIPDIQPKDNGTWHIVYGTKVVYKAPVEVTVLGEVESSNPNLKWITGNPVDMVVGPENAVYCLVRDPAGRMVSEHFGLCQITLDKATKNHNGHWTLTVVTAGRITTDQYWINVTVLDTKPRPEVITHVEKQQPDIILGCGLLGNHEVNEVMTCTFRDPAGRVLLASEGVAEDRYSFHGLNASLPANMNSSGCGLRIRDATTRDLGLWRCAMKTSDGDVHYGFLRVLCPWALQDESVAAAVVTEPTLTPYESSIWGPEGEVTLGCSIQSQIEYCYFRARNGTVYNINPGMNSNGMEYVGGGFEAGECGARMSLQAADSGSWSCHVGLPEPTAPEQRAAIDVHVQPAFTATQANTVGGLTVSAHEFEGRALDYCRYVRIDGFGFTEDNMPDWYTSLSDTQHGLCTLYIPQPTMLDHHPWTIAARLSGQSVELTATTHPTLVVPPQPPATSHNFFAARFWTLIILLCVSFGFLALILSTKKSRKWTSRQATAARSNSAVWAAAIRNSLRKNKTAENNTNTSNANPPVYTA